MASGLAQSTLALAIGITSSTVFMTMNTTLNYIAFPAYYLPSVQNARSSRSSPPPAEASQALLLRQWALTYATGHLVGPATSILSTAAFIFASRHVPAELRPLLYVAAASAAFAFPFTVIFVVKGNNELYRRADAVEKSRDEEEQAQAAGGDTLAMIAKCLWYSKIRALSPIPAILIGIYVLYASANV